MKLKALADFFMEDKKRGVMIARKAGEIFEMDETEGADRCLSAGQAIYSLLRDLRVTVVDEKFIPKKWRYLVVHDISFSNEAGESRSARPGAEVTLPQELACKFLVSGYIKPVDPDGWVPARLLGPAVKSTEPKKMFDDPTPPAREPWVRRRD
jgi:hypothetical protein